MTYVTDFLSVTISLVLLGICVMVFIAAVSQLIYMARRVVRDKRGVTALEYGLIAALIAVVIVGSASTLGTSLTTTFSSISSSLNKAVK